MRLGVNGEGHGLAALADVKVGARRVEALVADSHDLVLTHIAASVVTEACLRRLTDNEVTLVVNLGERVGRMNILGKSEAAFADIVIGANGALVPHATDATRAHIASGRVRSRGGWAGRTRGARLVMRRWRHGNGRCRDCRRYHVRRRIGTSTSTQAGSRSVVHVANHNLTRLHQCVELVCAVKVFTTTARIAKVKVLAIQALVADAANALSAVVTPGVMDSAGGWCRWNPGWGRASLGPYGMDTDTLRVVEMNHLMLGLVLKRLGAQGEASVAEIKVEADSALVAGPNNGLVTGIAVGGVNGSRR